MGTGVQDDGHPDVGRRAGDDARQKRLGRWGEELAVEYLAACGFIVLSRNWRCREGELDIVATDAKRLLVCEVKTRSGTSFGAPAESVTPAKVRRLRRLSGLWLTAHRMAWCAVRFDVIGILCPPGGRPRIAHFRDVF